MKIEPCLYCGEGMKELCYGDAQCLGCGAVVEHCNIPLHNRLSRIVRAAEVARDGAFRDDETCEWMTWDIVPLLVAFEDERVKKEAVEGGRA